MKIQKFTIKNFKGIKETTIRLSDEVPGNVGTLVGLNESGKTTILEALSHFVTEDKDTAGLVDTVQKRSSLQDLIPKSQKAAFNDSISVAASVQLDNDDIDSLASMFLEKHGLELNKIKQKRQIEVTRGYEFVESKLKDTHTWWRIHFHLKSKRAKSYKEITANKSAEDKKIWLAGVAHLRSRLPKIVYFPTFLFDFPDRIYLEKEDSETNAYYAQVIQDVLDSQGDNLRVDRHIIERIEALRTEHPTVATFLAFLFGTDERKQIDAVLQKVSAEMSRVIFGSWNEILGRRVTGKRVQIEWLLDGERENAAYLEVSIVDGQSKYSLSERSLGFRWFFSFLLFTQFRRNRKTDQATIFLFDEPAANLHSRAQMKLLESFDRIAHGTTYIVYSTHSHYMINPHWLEKAYIVENSATDYDNDDEVDAFHVRETDISAIRYRTFVGKNPTKTTYFQPVLDALQVTFSPLMRTQKALIVEGKFDYFPIEYLDNQANGDRPYSIFPANGAGDVGCLVSLFRGWSVDFRVLFDGDGAGKRGKKKIQKDYLLKDDEVQTLADISDALDGKSFEAVYQSDVVDLVKKHFSVSTPEKRHYSLFFQEAVSKGIAVDAPATQEAFEPLAKWIKQEFKASS